MAVNDIELSVGVKFDEAEFIGAYTSALSKTSAATQQVVDDSITNLHGSAASNWNTLPYLTMHDSSSGQRTAAKAFLASLAHDLNSAGITSKSQGFAAAMTNAAYIGSIPDATERFRRLRAGGFYSEAALTAPGSALSDAIESDYALMQQGWSRNFIKSRKNKAGAKEAFIDFKGMREYAVNEGIGRWKNEDMPHTADNFELINNQLEKIDKNSDKSKKTFTDWSDTLKGVLGTLTAIGSLTAIGKVFEVAYKSSEAATVAAGTTLDRKRAFIGMSALDVLATQKAGQSIGLGKEDIYNEILGLSQGKEKYKLLGEGLNELYPSLTGIFDNIMSSDNPYDIYKGIITEIYGRMEGADDTTRARTLMLLNSQGLGSVAEIIGAFLSNPAFADSMDNNPLNLFSLKENPYYGAYGRGEALLPKIVELNESIKASYTQMYEDWEEEFGLPFKKWWDRTLITTIVPWFEKILEYAKPEAREKRAKESEYKLATTSLDTKDPKKVMRDNDTMTDMRVRSAVAEVLTGDYGINGWNAIQSTNLIGTSKISNLFTKKGWQSVQYIADYDPLNRDKDNPRKWLSALNKLATEGVYKDSDETNSYILRGRAEQALSFLRESGLYNRLNDLEYDQSDTAVIRLLQKYLATEDEGLLDKFLYSSYGSTEDWQTIVKFVEEYRQYLKENPNRVTEIKVVLFDKFGTQLQSEVDSIVNRQ